MNLSESQRILTTAIETWKPVALVSLFSGGYDSAITTHALHRLDTHGLSIQVWAIDTQLSADGWREYVQGVATGQGWNFQIYDNKRGFEQFVTAVNFHGCPRTKAGHTWAFQRLKERGFDAILMMNKTSRGDKVLFVSGVRRAESTDREEADEIQRVGHSNKIFCSPIINWTNDDCDLYRVENNLPDNPFYNTVKGSGDCQCNWGNFITMRTLQKYSPALAAGNVATVDQISRELHGYGWDGKIEAQAEFLQDYSGEAQLTSPFLCAGCSRAKHRAPARIVESRILQAGLF
jgi:3'-phosphoadenosine 5'-phosphosulfate sulfotransferase (PAPS reductase)/FAD synthetase